MNLLTDINDTQGYLSVVVPVYNEEKTVRALLERVLPLPELLEIVVVDDGSKDRSAEIIAELAASNPKINLIKQSKNGGKTEALKTGFAVSRGKIVIVQDADLEYDPAEIPLIIQPIVEGNADVVYGSRFMTRKASRVLYFHHYLANQFLTFISNLLTNMNMSDVETCYKAFRGDIIRDMTLVSSGFGFEIEVTAKIAKLRCAVYETPISYYGRTYEEGKKITWVDGVHALWYIVYFNLFCSLESSFKSKRK